MIWISGKFSDDTSICWFLLPLEKPHPTNSSGNHNCSNLIVLPINCQMLPILLKANPSVYVPHSNPSIFLWLLHCHDACCGWLKRIGWLEMTQDPGGSQLHLRMWVFKKRVQSWWSLLCTTGLGDRVLGEQRTQRPAEPKTSSAYREEICTMVCCMWQRAP